MKTIFTIDSNATNKNAHLGGAIERLCLQVLNQLNFVPEHIETRSLYSSKQQEIEQGKLLMWMDMFRLSDGIPGPAVDISERKPKRSKSFNFI